MNEQCKEVPPLEFSRLGYGRRRTIRLSPSPDRRLSQYSDTHKSDRINDADRRVEQNLWYDEIICNLGSNNSDDRDIVVINVDDNDTDDDGNDDNINLDGLLYTNFNEDSDSVDSDVDSDASDQMPDMREYSSDSDHDPEITCRICYDDIDLDYHNVIEERRYNNWSRPYCEECNGFRHDPLLWYVEYG